MLILPSVGGRHSQQHVALWQPSIALNQRGWHSLVSVWEREGFIAFSPLGFECAVAPAYIQEACSRLVNASAFIPHNDVADSLPFLTVNHVPSEAMCTLGIRVHLSGWVNGCQLLVSLSQLKSLNLNH